MTPPYVSIGQIISDQIRAAEQAVREACAATAADELKPLRAELDRLRAANAQLLETCKCLVSISPLCYDDVLAVQKLAFSVISKTEADRCYAERQSHG